MAFSSLSVGLDRCPSYERQILEQSLQRLIGVCPVKMNLRSAKILLKPNLISARKSALACTDGRFILAAARLFLDRGARVMVGDSPAFGTASGVLEKIGVFTALRKMGVVVDDFTEIETVNLPSGIRVGLADAARNCDLLVNLPRIKAHAQMRVTLAVKNFFGCVAGLRKPYWHMRHGGSKGMFEHHLVELLSMLPESLTLADGITAMHRTGPIGGEPFALEITACSANPVALDRALLEIIALPPQISPIMEACMDAGLAGTDIARLVFPLLRPEDLRTEGFEVPDTLYPVRFNPFRYIQSNIKRIILQNRKIGY